MKLGTMLGLMICVSIVALGASPQQTSTTETTITTGPLTISAEQVISDSTAGTIKARGKVSVDIHKGAIKLQADELEIIIDRSSELIRALAKGNVRSDITDKDGSTQTTTSAQLQLTIKITP